MSLFSEYSASQFWSFILIAFLFVSFFLCRAWPVSLSLRKSYMQRHIPK